MTKHKNYFLDFTKFISPKPVYVGIVVQLWLMGMELQSLKRGFKFQASKEDCFLLRDDRLCMKGVRTVHDLYALEMHVLYPEVSTEQCRHPFGTRKQRATTPRELINIDVCGPMQQQSLGGAKYYVCFKNDFTKYCWVFFLQSKNEISNEAKNAGHMVKEVLSDGGGEVINLTVKSVLEKSEISFCMSMSYMPQQNEAAERENRTIVESARSMIYATNLPLKLWTEAVNTSVYHLHVFGTECFVHVPQQKRRKWDKKSIKGVFVGCSGETDGYRIWIKDQNKVILSRDVIFQNEKSVPDVSSTDIQNSGMEIVKKPLQTPDPDVEKEIEEISCSPKDTKETFAQQSSRNLRDRSIFKIPAKFDSFVLLAEHIEPETYKEAMTSEDSNKWLAAMKEELESLSNNTWRFKARLVAKGYSQKFGVDFSETFSPVVWWDTIRTVLSIVAAQKLKLGHFDIKIAFLYGDLSDNIYMSQPERFSDSSGQVC
ncbi:retrovirus-related Pol polyprotein from transposon TNT 1-94 [Nephila pilipes]|uniref:Retrovirus-related Pol polyprotein from transposon TNT 1-94 n=1 Tax=Nephila pilipes TaxID=299642 RepID=A0A8X6QN89_NEPPI|nr:retrovirus-related Pol polyprotein from transposon TNT 1-94 [Nephila pilipes]